MVAYQQVRLVVIDEFSMVGNEMLRLVNLRLAQIFRYDEKTEFFGGRHVIVVGDMFQVGFFFWLVKGAPDMLTVIIHRHL